MINKTFSREHRCPRGRFVCPGRGSYEYVFLRRSISYVVVVGPLYPVHAAGVYQLYRTLDGVDDNIAHAIK